MAKSRKKFEWKQTNKRHKPKVPSKRQVQRKLGRGRVVRKKDEAPSTSKNNSSLSLADRKNTQKQIKENKAESVWIRKRLAGGKEIPKLAVWVSLTANTDCEAVQNLMTRSCEDGKVFFHTGEWEKQRSMRTFKFEKFDQRVTFMRPNRNGMDVLQFLQVADILIFVIDINEAIDEDGLSILSLIKNQGVPATIGIVDGLDRAITVKQKKNGRASAQKFLVSELGDCVKFADSNSEVQLVRAITTIPPKKIYWRANRSYFLADRSSFKMPENSDCSDRGTLRLCGYIRGKPLNVNQVIHLCGVGAFHLQQINIAEELFPSRPSEVLNMSISNELCTADPSQQETLKMEAEVDEMAREQTWPTNEELADSDIKNSNEALAYPEIKKDELSDGMDAEDSDQTSIEFDDDKWATESMFDSASAANAAYSKKLMRRTSEKLTEEEDKEFPDEVNTPIDIPARERFARYRALKSFRTSPWHPKESLPPDYARIFQFENFQSAQKSVLKQGKQVEDEQNLQIAQRNFKLSRSHSGSRSVVDSMSADGGRDDASTCATESFIAGREGYVAAGTYVELVLANVPKQAAERVSEPLICFSLLPFEQKLSVLHFRILRAAKSVGTVKSKDRLVIQCGFRRWTARPIFSELSLNCDKNKFERYLRHEDYACASVYGPATYMPAPVFLFKETIDEGTKILSYELIASGTLIGVDPDRIILKKIKLTGYPVKVHKRRAVVKYMFYTQEDVKWFRPADLETKFGLTGSIRAPIGTHGDMKADFSRNIAQNDTVCLSLYKRVYPKFEGDQCSATNE